MRGIATAISESSTHGALDLGTTTVCCAFTVVSKTGNRSEVRYLTDYPEAHGSDSPYTQVVTPALIAYRIKRGGFKEIRWGAAVDRTTRNNSWHVFRNLKATLVESAWTETSRKNYKETLERLNDDFKAYGTISSEEPMEDFLRALANHWQDMLQVQKLPKLSSLTVCVPSNLTAEGKARLRIICGKAFGFKPSQEFPMEAEAVIHAMLEQGGHGFEAGDEVIILDLGGLTCDCSTFKILSLDPVVIDEAAKSHGFPCGALLMNEEFEVWVEKMIAKFDELNITEVSQLKRYATTDFETDLKFHTPSREMYTSWLCGKKIIEFTEKDRIQVWDNAQKPILKWAVEQVKKNRNITKIVPVGGLWKNLYLQQQFKRLIQDLGIGLEKIHEVVPMSQLLTLVAHGGLVAALRLHYVRSRYLCSNICYAFSEPYQPKYKDWEVCERKGEKILYVNAAAVAFCSGTKLCNTSLRERPHHAWLYREAKDFLQLKEDLANLSKTLYLYDGKLPPFDSEGTDLRFWNVRDCVLWKKLVLQFDITQLKGVKKVGKLYQFYYRLEASIDGLSVIFHARARPDGRWKDDNLTMTATCSTQVDAALHGDTKNPSSPDSISETSDGSPLLHTGPSRGGDPSKLPRPGENRRIQEAFEGERLPDTTVHSPDEHQNNRKLGEKRLPDGSNDTEARILPKRVRSNRSLSAPPETVILEDLLKQSSRTGDTDADFEPESPI